MLEIRDVDYVIREVFRDEYSFSVPGIPGIFSYILFRERWKVGECLELGDYTICYSQDVFVMRGERKKRAEIRIFIDFSPSRGKCQIRNRTKPMGKSAPEYETIANSVIATVMSLCVIAPITAADYR